MNYRERRSRIYLVIISILHRAAKEGHKNVFNCKLLSRAKYNKSRTSPFKIDDSETSHSKESSSKCFAVILYCSKKAMIKMVN